MILDLGFTIVETDYIESAAIIDADNPIADAGVNIRFISGQEIFVACNTEGRTHLATTALDPEAFLEHIKKCMRNKSINLGQPAASTI